MKKTLLLFIAGCISLCSSYASVSAISDGRTTVAQTGNNGYASSSRPRVPRQTIFPLQITHEQEIKSLVIASYNDVEQVYFVMEDPFDDSPYMYLFASPEMALIPIANQTGICTTVIYCETGETVSCDIWIE